MEEGGQALSAVMNICDKAMNDARQMLAAIPREAATPVSSSSALDMRKGLVFYSEDKKYKLVAYERVDSCSSTSVQSKDKISVAVRSRKSQVDTAISTQAKKIPMPRTIPVDMSLLFQAVEDRSRQSRKKKSKKFPVDRQENRSVQLVALQPRKSQVIVSPVQSSKSQMNTALEDLPYRKSRDDSQSRKKKKTTVAVKPKKSQVDTARDCNTLKAVRAPSVQKICSTGERKMSHEEAFEKKELSYKLRLEALIGGDGKLKQIEINGKKINI